MTLPYSDGVQGMPATLQQQPMLTMQAIQSRSR